MSTQNPTEKAPAMPLELQPKCPACKQPFVGFNVSGLKLPIPSPDGKSVAGFMNFMVMCCPNLECGVVMGTQFTGNEAAPAPGAAAGLWTPPGSR